MPFIFPCTFQMFASFLSSYIHDGIDNVLSSDLCLEHDVFVLSFVTPSFSLLFGKGEVP